MNIGSAIRNARKLAGMSRQSDLAERLAVDTSAVSRWESGRSRPDDETLAAIEHALGLRRGQLLIDAGLVDVDEIKTSPTPWDDLSPADQRLILDLVASLSGKQPRRQ